jgi:ABC-type lipoprotein export system ATPase subunit
MNPILKLTDVTRVHGDGATQVHALRGVSFTAHAGELVAVMGPSGSGKSTLLNLAGGLDLPTAGLVAVEGTPLFGLSAANLAALRRRSIGYVFQDLNLIPSLTAAENAALPLELDGFGVKQARASALASLESVGVAELADRFPEEMSGGQQQRVVQTQRTATLRHLQDLTRLKSRTDPAKAPRHELAWQLVLENLVYAAEGEVRWLDHVEASLARAAAGRSAGDTSRQGTHTHSAGPGDDPEAHDIHDTPAASRRRRR